MPAAAAEAPVVLHPPAMPLVTFDPYLSVWSAADKLTDKNTQHGTRREPSLASVIRIDGKTYRPPGAEPTGVPALSQISLQVTPTRSIYAYNDAGAHGELSFLTGAQALLKPGAQILSAADCHQATGGQDIDIGIASVEASWQTQLLHHLVHYCGRMLFGSFDCNVT